ncbi:putative phosphatidylinositide phosphatase [Butyriboletus roseoflavus]|nr:putative phosphatidylinositide phosphatase [Butyriboletus roseoflavus]
MIPLLKLGLIYLPIAQTVFDENHSIYSVKSVHAIPLVKDRAQHVLDTIASHISLSHIPDDGTQDFALASQREESTSNARVKFADGNDVKIMSPAVDTVGDTQAEELHSSPPSSGTSTPASSESLANHNVVKAIADRMSFWTRLSRRQPTSTHDSATDSDEHQSLDSIIQSVQGEPTAVIDSIIASTAPPPESVEERHTELEDRVIRECIREYVKGCMYFAYHFDITRSLQNKHDQFLRLRTEENLLAKLNALPPDPSIEHPHSKVDPLVEPFATLPLWRRVNREFWWNEWLSKPFVDAGMHSYVLPIVQGHFQVSFFDLPTNSYMSEHDPVSHVNYLIASRRSRYRAGLRYQRRGVDEEARVANFVETEAIMSIKRNGIANVFSFVQIRGSVPLYWTQSGYSMKPPPVLLPECSSDQNLDAMKRHFQRTIPIYGPHTIVNLAEQTGKESALTNAYKSYAKRMENKDIRYYEYDFHHETRGMKYENISKLINELERTFESQGYFWISDHVLLSKQRGIFRVNCVDCLDRTNVVQSAFARHALGVQLEAVGLAVEPQTGRPGMDIVFNDVWANNGDAISRAYAGTSALKGDFTRTGKRDLGGLFNDGVNSLARMYSATFSDWFCQAVIDFMLGYRTTSVFSEFLLKLQSTDPRELIRLSKVRAEAIATSVSRVLEEGEPVLAGWTLVAPEQLNVKVSDKFEEKILLLSVRALYIVRYDYTLEKVKLYTRVPLGMITKITKGAYILSPLEEASRDPTQNAGFSVTWLNTDLVSSRTTSYSYRNCPVDISKSDNALSSHVEEHSQLISGGENNVGNRLLRMIHTRATSKLGISSNRTESNDTSFAAFKALPVGSARVRNGSRYTEPADDLASAKSCKEAVDLIVDAIKRACEDIGSASGDDFTSEEDIVSVSEAQRTTSIYAKMEYGVKRLLWLGG